MPSSWPILSQMQAKEGLDNVILFHLTHTYIFMKFQGYSRLWDVLELFI